MKHVIAFVLFSFVSVSFAAESCSRYCNPDRSKPCGSACIPKDNNCRKSWTTACSGIRPAAEKGAVYATPKKVDQRPAGE